MCVCAHVDKQATLCTASTRQWLISMAVPSPNILLLLRKCKSVVVVQHSSSWWEGLDMSQFPAGGQYTHPCQYMYHLPADSQCTWCKYMCQFIADSIVHSASLHTSTPLVTSIHIHASTCTSSQQIACVGGASACISSQQCAW